MTNTLEILRKAGFRLTPLPSPQLTPDQEKHLQNVNQQVRKFLKMMDEAHKASAHSKLHFIAPIARHSICRNSVQNPHQKIRD